MLESAYSTTGDPPSKRMLLQAALGLFAKKGIHAVTVREIADSAGYTNPALFKFFASKDALALHLFESCYTRLFDDLSEAAGPALAFPDRLRAILGVFFAQIEGEVEAFLFVQDHLRELWPHASKETRKRSILGLIRATLQQGVREGKVNGAIHIDLLVAAIAGTLGQFARMYYFGEFAKGAGDWPGEVEQIINRMVAP